MGVGEQERITAVFGKMLNLVFRKSKFEWIRKVYIWL